LFPDEWWLGRLSNKHFLFRISWMGWVALSHLDKNRKSHSNKIKTRIFRLGLQALTIRLQHPWETTTPGRMTRINKSACCNAWQVECFYAKLLCKTRRSFTSLHDFHVMCNQKELSLQPKLNSSLCARREKISFTNGFIQRWVDRWIGNMSKWWWS
jgi:hypothetical protein